MKSGNETVHLLGMEFGNETVHLQRRQEGGFEQIKRTTPGSATGLFTYLEEGSWTFLSQQVAQ